MSDIASTSTVNTTIKLWSNATSNTLFTTYTTGVSNTASIIGNYWVNPQPLHPLEIKVDPEVYLSISKDPEHLDEPWLQFCLKQLQDLTKKYKQAIQKKARIRRAEVAKEILKKRGVC